MGFSKSSILRQRWLELRLLCRPGIGLATIAPPVCRLAREIVGAEAASIFWLDGNGMPLGFFHEDSPEEVRDLFANNFERLFVGPEEINVFSLSRSNGAPCGRLLTPPPGFFLSNTYNLLLRPSGHHHSLDLRVEDAEGGRAVLLLFRGRHPSFTDREAATLTLFDPLLRRAGARANGTSWQSAASDPGHMLVDIRGERILSICDVAERLLRGSSLVGQGLTAHGTLQAPPRFVADLCAQLAQSEDANMVVTIPAGRLRVEARQMHTPGRDPSVYRQVLITLHHEAPTGIGLIAPILEHRLSPLRSEILLYAASGGAREMVPQAFEISKEATKKHLAEIYRTIGVGHWHDIPHALLSAKPEQYST